jgi:hypothetical protein
MTSRPNIEMLATRFDLPESVLRAEQRMAERALRRWMLAEESEIKGFDDNGLIIVDPAGRVEIDRIAEKIAHAFRLRVGQLLALDPGPSPHGLGSELCAVCDLVMLGGRPVPFEASLTGSGLGQILARGIALPIAQDRVQIVMSWREVLSRSAASRLRQELAQALESRVRTAAAHDPLPVGRPLSQHRDTK